MMFWTLIENSTEEKKNDWINQTNFSKYHEHINLIYSNSCSHAISINNCVCIESNTIFLLFECYVVDDDAVVVIVIVIVMPQL